MFDFAIIRSRYTAALLAVAWFALAGGVASAEEAKPPKVNYDEQVKPILREHCFSCHGPDKKESDLALDNYAALIRGGASGEVVAAGDLESSRLWALVSHAEEPKMPPKQDKLPEAKLAIIKQWITGGALENAGSTAKVAKKPAIDLKVAGGGKKPDGPPPMPVGLSRQPVVYSARAAAVTALAASPWAPLVAVGGQKQILLYHAESGQLLGVLPFPEGIPHVIKFSRSGTLLLTAGGRGGQSGKAVVYEVATGKRVFEIGDELDAVLAADINSTHSMIALGGPSRVVRVYSTADGSLVHEIRKHTDWINAVEFSPDGVLLATADRTGGLFVWEADTAHEYQNLPNHKAGVTDVSWRADSNLLASCSEDGSIKLWEMENGGEVKNIGAHGGGVSAIEFVADGRIVSCGRDRTVKVWDGNGGQQRAFEAMADLALEVAVTGDGSRVVAGDWTGAVRAWQTSDGKALFALPANPPTLEMLVQAESGKAQAAAAALEKAAAELAAADAALAASVQSADAAAAQVVTLKAESDRVAAQLAAAQKDLADKTAATAAATEPTAKEATEVARAESQKAVDAATTATGAAASALAAGQTEAQKLADVKAESQKARDAKAAAHAAAVATSTAANAARDTVTAEKAAFDTARAAAK